MGTPVNSASSLSAITNELNNVSRQLEAFGQIQSFKDSNGIRRVLIGRGANDFYGLKVSKPDIDVYTATDDQLLFNSDDVVFKIAKVLNGSFAAEFPAGPSGAGAWIGASNNSLILAHGLSYTPGVMVFAASTSGETAITDGALMYVPGWNITNPVGYYNVSGYMIGWGGYYWRILTDATNVTINGFISASHGVQRSSTGGGSFPSVDLTVYCLQEMAA